MLGVSAIYMLVMRLAGDQVAVVPDLAANVGNDIYSVIIIAYLLFGVIVNCAAAWIGMQTGHELVNSINVSDKFYPPMPPLIFMR